MNTSAIGHSVLNLPQQERAHLVRVLLDSLDAFTSVDIQDGRRSEARRRADEIDVVKVNLVRGEQCLNGKFKHCSCEVLTSPRSR